MSAQKKAPRLCGRGITGFCRRAGISSKAFLTLQNKVYQVETLVSRVRHALNLVFVFDTNRVAA